MAVWCRGVRAVVWRAPTYNDGNGCGGAVQVQYRPIRALEVPAANGV